MIRASTKEHLHPRNRFRAGYDFDRLITGTPSLAAFVGPNAHGDASIDYANPDAVKALNQALLSDAYGIEVWDVPPGYLCPPIPGRSDYVHQIADLLGQATQATILDIGTGASCIYPLIGAREYGWRFVGTEIDPVALMWAQELVAANPSVSGLIECRSQPVSQHVFEGVIKSGEVFDATMCNPPFHPSAYAAAEGSWQKRRNLGARRPRTAPLNFGGQAGELWCDGGELGFIQRMIVESVAWADRCRWFTTLVSKSTNLPPLYDALTRVKASDVKTIEMAQGQKKSRILAWKFTETSAER